MAVLTPDMVRRFWVLVSETSRSHAPGTLEDWVALYQDHYGFSQLESKALMAYIQSRLPLIHSLM
jgi:hypothetical protein